MDIKPDKPKLTVSHFGQKIYRVDPSLAFRVPDKTKVPDYGNEDIEKDKRGIESFRSNLTTSMVDIDF